MVALLKISKPSRFGCFVCGNLRLLEISRLELAFLSYGVIGLSSPHILERRRSGQTLRPEACFQAISLNGCLLLWALCASWLFLALDINQSFLFFLDKYPSFLNWTAWLGFLISLLSEKFKLLNKPLQASSNSGTPQRRQDADGSAVTHTSTYTASVHLTVSVSYPDHAGSREYVYFTRAKLENLLNETTFATWLLAVLPTQWKN